MKKIICILVSFFILGSTSFAQTKETKKPKAKTEKKEPAKTVAPTEQPKKEATGKTEPRKASPKIKKDGTPDKRYKENKEDKTSKGTAVKDTKLKKDGTPDKRYKENKESAKAVKKK